MTRADARGVSLFGVPGRVIVLVCGFGPAAFAACNAAVPPGPIPLGLGPALSVAAPGTQAGPAGVATLSPFVAVAWVASAEGRSDVFVSVSRDDGGSFETPRRVSTPNDRVRPGDPPAVSFVPIDRTEPPDSPPLLVIAWRGAGGGDEEAGPVTASRSSDGGRTFETISVSPDGDACGAPSSMAVADGRVLIAWEDCRSAVTVADLDARLPQTVASHRFAVDACGNPGVTTATTGKVSFVARARRPGSGVDLVTVDADSREQDPTWAGFTWPETACGDLGGAAAEGDGAVHLTWVDRGVGHVFYAGLRDGWISTGPQALDSSGASSFGRAQLVVEGARGVVAVWEEERGGTHRVLLRQLAPAHHGPVQPLPSIVLSGTAPARQPAVAGLPGGVIVAWNGVGEDTITLRRIGLDAVCLPPVGPAGREVPQS